ncbi:MAG: kinase-like domain-containing protein [Linnemannia elongata]|nr:MAG: kinase-like domain-containing protein [Linnemannia elongata]
MERISSTGSTKRPSSIHSGSGYMPTSPVSSLPPPSLLHDDVFSNNPEDYDIRLPIGYGSSAVVYNAYYKPLNRRVAIKVIDLDMFERNQIDELRRETQVMALCKHPNVLRVNGAFVTDSKLYIVTPYLSAGSCLDIMKTAYPEGFDEISIATILKQALQGLDYLHKNGHIHRDVKAGNLLVDDDGSVLLGDFGVSSSLMENGDRRGQRKTFVGTPCWMAPEVMEQAGYDYKADIWSFGITAIELATGHAPFAKYPPIKVLMLTLSNDPPTLDRESTKHRYSKLLKEMIDCCLQKDASRRPSAEKLLNHSFFKQAKKKSHLVTGLLHNLPPLEQRPPKKAPPKANIPEKGVSWDFGAEDTPDEPVRRPRTVTFERPDRPVSTATTESAVSGTLISESRSLDSMPEDDSQQQIGTPASSHSGDKPVKKSRFVVEDSSSAVSSPPTSNHGTESNLSPSGMASPSLSHTVVNPVPVPGSQTLHGLGVSSNGAEPISTPEVRKGRFSVKDTTLNIASPTPMSVKIAGGESLMSPSRSLSSSPVEGVLDGVHIGAPLELGPSERKSRFEVHHSHAGALTPTNGTGLNSPVLSATQILSREPSQSRVAGDLGLSRESSATRVSRFSVEPSQSPQEPGSSSAAASAAGTPNASQSKRSRFQVSNVEGRPGDIATDIGGSAHSTPNTSPSASLLRGQVDIMEGQGTPAVFAHLETLYRQNEQQRVILTELFAGLGLKAGSSISSATKSQLSHIEIQSTSAAPSSASSGQGQASMERQLQSTIRENESLRRENEALKRELERLRRVGL